MSGIPALRRLRQEDAMSLRPVWAKSKTVSKTLPAGDRTYKELQ